MCGLDSCQPPADSHSSRHSPCRVECGTPTVLVEGHEAPFMFFPEELKRDYSVACHRLLQLARQEFGKHFEFVWVVMPNGNASFRSDRFNVLPIAKAMGGGGHTKASGTADKEKIAEVLEQNGIQYPRS